MAHKQVDIGGKNAGSMWTRRPTPSSKNGLVLEVSNTKTGLTSQGQHLQFTRVAFGCHGNWFIAGDHLGNLYMFDYSKNRFKLVHKTGQFCTAITTCMSRPNEILVATADNSLKCVDIDSCNVVANMRGHEASVKSISLHSSGHYALAVSSRDSILWDLNNFSKCRTLTGGQEVGVQDVFFLPLSNTIISCFKDDSIHAWESDSLEYKYQIPPPCGPTPHYRAFTVSRDGRLLVAAGRSSFIHIWKMETKQLLRLIQLPSKVRLVKQLVFLTSSFDGGTSEILGFLAQDGILRFINIHSCRLLFQIGSQENMLSSAHMGPDGNIIVCISERGNILVYDVPSVTQSLHRPPAPVVKILDDNTDSAVKTSTIVNSFKSNQKHRTPKTTPLVPKKPGVQISDKAGSKDVENGVAGGKLSVEQLLSILKGYGEYPDKYRTFIWRCLLRLPDNHSAYSSLLDKGTHPGFISLHQDYPIKSRKLLRVLQRALSALGHWAAIFAETPYLPGLVFPFVKLFQNNQLVTFETLATILLNWCGQWFEYFPNPPLNVLALVENCLAHHDSRLLEHFIKHDITSHQYAWPLLETLFSEVLSRDCWLKVWDNILSNHPGFLLLVATSYLTSARHTLFQCSQREDFDYFFHHQSTVDVGAMIREAYHMQMTTPSEIHPEKLLDSFVPLTKGTYPVFNKYPRFIVDYQVQERERIRREELDYLSERQSALELERLTEQRRQEEEAWYRQQELLMGAEEQRRKMIANEDMKLTDQRARLQALKRELKVKEIHVLDATRRRFLQHQQNVKETELKRMDQELQRKVVQRETETKNVVSDVEVRALELERQKALLEQELVKGQEEILYRLRADVAAQAHRQQLEQSMLDRVVEVDATRERKKLDRAQVKLAKLQTEKANLQMLQEAHARRALRDIQREVQMEEVIGKAHCNRVTEKGIHRLTKCLAKENKRNIRQEVKHAKRLAHETSGSVDGVVRAGGGSQLSGGVLGATQLSADGGGEDGLTVTTLSSTETSDYTSSTTNGQQSSTLSSIGQSGLDWSKRRDTLDRQEAALLSRVNDIRQKVAAGNIDSTSSASSFGAVR